MHALEINFIVPERVVGIEAYGQVAKRHSGLSPRDQARTAANVNRASRHAAPAAPTLHRDLVGRAGGRVALVATLGKVGP
jgi:hypothetical protein